MTDLSRMSARALQIAADQLGVREVGGRNRGPQVDEYLREGGGLDPEGHAYHWCAGFVSWCLRKAAAELGMPPPPKAASVGKLWRIWNDQHSRSCSPGALFLHLSDVHDLYSPGHVGFVTHVQGNEYIDTIEGNTNAEGSRDGDCVAAKRRPLSFANLGFIDFTNKGDLVG